ncbi:alpha/beta hydrolase [Solihabitans fulvus]|uniref:Alpha/beta hydrolase n=1 Tax=Solihabitans fulvus TaxID=1892852 RepID=A0A5B2XU54_9PSEU|nr:alpha/beta hydrolase [Solihabitans fulvus]KAA2266462.1 alpha/beta hydrolase [Solihabitans fulvus]
MGTDRATGLLPVTDGELYYESAGDGPSVVLLHGGMLTAETWDEQFALLADAGYRVIRYDARNHGRSSTSTGDFRHYEDLRELLAGLGVRSAALVGLSLGARIAVDFALAHPDLVDALVAISPGISGYAFVEPVTLGQMNSAFQFFAAGDLPQGVEWFLRAWVDGPLRTPDQLDPGLRERLGQISLRSITPHSGMVGGAQELDAANRLGELRTPLLTMVGDLDSSDIRAIAGLLAEVPGAERVDLPGAGHMLNLELPEQVDRLLLDFLGRQLS